MSDRRMVIIFVLLVVTIVLVSVFVLQGEDRGASETSPAEAEPDFFISDFGP